MTQPTDTSFAQLTLPAEQISNLADLGYTQMTPIQQLSLPAILEGQDLIAQAQTGSGKTAAFGIGLLTRINPRFFGVQTLVMCPTRELATQVANELRKLARYLSNIKILTLCGGQAIGPQIGSLEHGAHIVVGTPGRLKDHLRKGTLDLGQVHTLVLDEADRMLEMGFQEDISTLIGATPERRQTLLFSATYPDNIAQMSAQYQHNPLRVEAPTFKVENKITQYHVIQKDDDKNAPLLSILQKFNPASAVLFCNTRQRCEEFAATLKQARYQLRVLHGDMEQRDRDQVLTQFSNRSCTLLIATDVAARGLDVDDVELVINIDLPRDPAVYTHRIGRTGRAGKEGIAVNLVGPKEHMKLERIQKEQADPGELLEFLPPINPNFEPKRAPMRTLSLAGGRKNKLRPGDIVGTLTADKRIKGDQIGNISVTEFTTCVAVERALADTALDILRSRTIKGKSFRVRKL